MKNLLWIVLLFPLAHSLAAEQSNESVCRNPSRHIMQDKAQKSTYQNCKRNGMTWWYTSTGNIKSKVNFKDGKEDGLYTSYYENGNKKLVVNFVHGEKEGIQRLYYDNGQLGLEVNYVKGKREGILTEWDNEGFKYSEVFYKNNYKVGLKRYFDHKGEVIRTEEYKMDRNPVMQQLLKDKRKEIMVDLAKYGLMPEDAPEEDRIR